ncbi:MAG: CRISPR-associated endonuclease Cas3'' [Methylococcales bacterium]|nr:CRISPR-associated endonuclease Cas3'' [Methylococcales bacterium]
MMVTFVSQCEHKALNRTRRVLDAFANRIGTNTWQTIITEDGLQAVKKLLRKTASKNTAVSCHWIRSRSRSEFLWVVGKKDEFNAQGIVPVNYTNQIDALKMDEINVNIENYYANTKKQALAQHLFAVGTVAYLLMKRFSLGEDAKNLPETAFVAGYLHDIGKIDPEFQQWVNKEIKKKSPIGIPDEGQHIEKGKFSFESHPRHNEISLLLYHLLSDKEIYKREKSKVKHAIYWHHAKPIRKTEFKSFDPIYKKLKKNLGDPGFFALFQVFKSTIKQINALIEDSELDDKLALEGFLSKADSDLVDELENTLLPKYKRYAESNDEIEEYLEDVKGNAQNNLIRSTVITADRMVSKLSSDVLQQTIEENTFSDLVDKALIKDRGLITTIQECLAGFEKQYPNSVRNQQQTEAATELANEEVQVAVLSGAAGCGKTKIALEWAAKTGVKKIIWVCPRVQVCQGIFSDLKADNYLPNARIELNTGEFKQTHLLSQSSEPYETPDNELFSGDIVITTIDQITNAIITHRNVDSLVDYMTAHVVFDEYHEYINMPAFNLLFAELIECKRLQENNAKALLVSATPNYYFVESLLGLNEYDIIEVDSFNKSQYQIDWQTFDEGKQDETNPLYKSQPANSFVISNTAITAQLSFIANQSAENALLFHGKYKKTDKQAIFEQVFDNFKENGTHHYDVLRSGPIVQASLNISCNRMVTEFTHAENWLQRLGRLDRFGKNEAVNHYITAIPSSLSAGGKQFSRCARFLNNLHSLQSAKAWGEFLKAELSDETVTIQQIYQLYKQFYQNSTHRKAIEEDLKKALKQSSEVINNKLLDPISLPHKKLLKETAVKIKKQSLRGDNRFVQMAACKINSFDDISYPNEYAYSETELEANLTYPVENICGYGVSEKNLLAFMAKKHHNIKEAKKAYKDNALLNEARSPETPVYLSYTLEDLKKVEAQPHPYAIYYAQGIKQVIGAISVDKVQDK